MTPIPDYLAEHARVLPALLLAVIGDAPAPEGAVVAHSMFLRGDNPLLVQTGNGNGVSACVNPETHVVLVVMQADHPDKGRFWHEVPLTYAMVRSDMDAAVHIVLDSADRFATSD